VIYKDLAKAIRHESGVAICYWWGVTGQTVSKWRKAMKVCAVTQGTSRLKRDNFNQPWGQAARRRAWSKNRDPERCLKIAESLRGKSCPPEVMAPAHQANRGRKHSAETRAKMSAARKRGLAQS
jgi:hypothetical protein